MSDVQSVRKPSLGFSPAQDDPVSGILTFIIADLIVFAFLFVGFMVERHHQLELFNDASAALSVDFGIINTLILVSSGVLVVYAVEAARQGNAESFRQWVAVAVVVGAGFGVSKVIEWGDKFSHGINLLTNDFYMFYFALTGAHFLHFLGGMAALVYVWTLSFTKPVNGQAYTKIEAVALYWHMVDLLWLLIFPLLYLLDV